VTVVRINWENWRLGALRLSISSTVLIFLVIPAGVIALVAGLVLAGGRHASPDRRYRPGRPYDFQPIWFLASPEHVTGHGDAGHAQKALTGSALEDSTGSLVRPGSTGGASDSW